MRAQARRDQTTHHTDVGCRRSRKDRPASRHSGRGFSSWGGRRAATFGSNIRWGNADAGRLKTYAAEVATAAPDVILVGGTTALIPTHKATRSIPIVFVGSADPVGQGFVERLPRPGGNMTGFTDFRRFRSSAKLLEALTQIAPGMSAGRAASIARPIPTLPTIGVRSRRVAPTFNVKPVAAPVRDADEIERAFAALTGAKNGGLLVPPDAVTTAQRDLIIALAARYRLPAVYPSASSSPAAA